MRNSVDTVTLSLLLGYLISINSKTARALRFTNQIKNRLWSCQKLFEFEKLPQEKSDGEALPEGWPKTGKIEFTDVELRYRPDTELVLNKICMKIGDGEKIGVVGRTGAGKSTLGLTLSRLVEI